MAAAAAITNPAPAAQALLRRSWLRSSPSTSAGVRPSSRAAMRIEASRTALPRASGLASAAVPDRSAYSGSVFRCPRRQDGNASETAQSKSCRAGSQRMVPPLFTISTRSADRFSSHQPISLATHVDLADVGLAMRMSHSHWASASRTARSSAEDTGKSVPSRKMRRLGRGEYQGRDSR